MLQRDPFLVPHLEWEAVEFPLAVRGLAFDPFNGEFDPLATATVWRDTNCQLKGSIRGRWKDPAALDQYGYIGKGNIITQAILNGTDKHGNHVRLSGCVLGGFHTNSAAVNGQGYDIQSDLLFDTLQVSFTSTPVHQSKDSIQFEWYQCEHIDPHFWGRTYRSLDAKDKKVRIGLDHYDEDDPDFRFRSAKKDFFVLDTNEFTCIVAKVPKELMPNDMEGLCLEFRNSNIGVIDHSIIDDLACFLSFMLGAKLYHFGNSRLENNILAHAFLKNPHLPLDPQPAVPPVHYNFKYEWGDFALQANSLFPFYRKLQQPLSLNHAIDRIWTALEMSMGVNLPILAGAVEIIASGYLKMSGNDQLTYLAKDDYEQLIATELGSLREKLLHLEGGEIMLNKISGAFRKGVNEKMTFFFNLLGMEIGKTEKAAINLRNKMVHGKRDYQKEETIFDDIVLTRVYQVLFNRIVLKLLGYQGYYIDYSMENSPSRSLDNT